MIFANYHLQLISLISIWKSLLSPIYSRYTLRHSVSFLCKSRMRVPKAMCALVHAKLKSHEGFFHTCSYLFILRPAGLWLKKSLIPTIHITALRTVIHHPARVGLVTFPCDCPSRARCVSVINCKGKHWKVDFKISINTKAYRTFIQRIHCFEINED